MQKSKPKGTYNLTKMRPVVARYADFTGTKKDYCAGLGLNVHTFDYWRKRVKESKPPTKKTQTKAPLPAAPKFVELPAPPPSSVIYTLHLPDGKRLDLPLGTPLPVLTHLLQLSL